ncbi:MazG-like family protein [Aerococcaceae bacterium zg-ZJ1578]|uniref:MazG-like family protein n=1 Tax=Aerococcaceae bacterium zg-252 TaxID=2796928 RepID=UPI001A2841AE|nr:MazG-like family protein [Aerococcaceae bacterium zg-1578]MBS4461214.1 MazG-like family protein [Aerococcaceae bacterium zg-B36]
MLDVKVDVVNVLEDVVREWFVERGLHEGDGSGQLIKLREEVQELLDAHEADNEEDVIDAVGDITVVLIGYAMQKGLRLGECLLSAYGEIRHRTGHVDENGVFVKDE